MLPSPFNEREMRVLHDVGPPRPGVKLTAAAMKNILVGGGRRLPVPAANV